MDLVTHSDLSRYEWKDVDEYAYVRQLGTVTEHQAVDDAHAQALVMFADCSGPFAVAVERTSWRWNPDRSVRRLPQVLLTC
ncbi:hypothetical protein [Streptomyces sp. NPDC014685]|uniref:hypothetical protein n=1 Tax=Streptomyces sp. NPDC014685 TaxID=3364881 RepID=UPI0036F6CA13